MNGDGPGQGGVAQGAGHAHSSHCRPSLAAILSSRTMGVFPIRLSTDGSTESDTGGMLGAECRG